MRRSLRSQDKSFYLAIALCPCVQFHSVYDRQNSQDRQFYFQLTKNDQTFEKTHVFGIQTMIKQIQMYLSLSLPNYTLNPDDSYFLRLVELADQDLLVLFEEKLNIAKYINEHKTEERDFWTQYPRTQNKTQKIIIKQRIFMKKTKFQLDDIINSSQKGQQLDIVQIMNHPTQYKKVQFGIDKRKSKSFQSSHSSFIPPKRLDTISEEDNNLLSNDKKQRHSLGDEPQLKFKRSISQHDGQQFELSLKKNSTWIQKNRNFDDEFLKEFDHHIQPNTERINHNHHDLNSQQNQQINSNPLEQQNLLNPYKKRGSTQGQFSQRGSKISKLTKDTQNQHDEHEISFMQKSMILSDLDSSELSITADQQKYFKLKWIILILIVLTLAVIASLSTDAFVIMHNGKPKSKSNKKHNKQSHHHEGQNSNKENNHKTTSKNNKNKKTNKKPIKPKQIQV